MKNNILYIIALSLIISCSSSKEEGKSSSSPENDGIEIAQKYCDCEKEHIENRNNAYQNFLQNFGSYGFTSRIEAREKIKDIESGLENKYLSNKKAVDDNYKELSNKYLSDYDKSTKFESAFSDYYNANIRANTNDSQYELFQNKINQKIATIIPPAPDVEKIQNDLIGRTIKEEENGYHWRRGWIWKIVAGEVKNVEIVEKKAQGEDYVYKLTVTVQAEQGPAYKALVNVTYQLLDDADDWSIEYMESLSVNIVKTGKYDTCIEHYIKRGTGIASRVELLLINRCDIGLQVGGRVRRENNWHKFVVVVEPNEPRGVKYEGWLDVDEYVIDFIELP